MFFWNGSTYYDDSGTPVDFGTAQSNGYVDLLRGEGGAFVAGTTPQLSLADQLAANYAQPAVADSLLAQAPRYAAGFTSQDPAFAAYWPLYGPFPVNGTSAEQLAWLQKAAVGGALEANRQDVVDESRGWEGFLNQTFPVAAASALVGAMIAPAIAASAAVDAAPAAASLAPVASSSSSATADALAGAFDQFGSLGTPAVEGVGGAGYVPVDALSYSAATGSSLTAALTGNAAAAAPGVGDAGAFDQFGSLGTPAVEGVGGAGYVPVETAAYMNATGSSLVSALTGVAEPLMPPAKLPTPSTPAKSLSQSFPDGESQTAPSSSGLSLSDALGLTKLAGSVAGLWAALQGVGSSPRAATATPFFFRLRVAQ